MSRIRRLSIRGARNFGPESEEALIKFSRPLTLILGPNGTGKTTIIEALKFATSGEFPPDADKGKAFVYDPVFSTTSTVKCSVKAEVIDARGDMYCISRTLESGKVHSKPYIKTLDNSITRTKKGEKMQVSVSNRCIDADAEIAMALGVSKAILKYVIFCHQEDLNWPFESGKVLKEKFDEIFDSTRFNKAIENIAKQAKELQGDLRVLKSEVNNSQLLVSEVKKREAKLAEQKKRLEDYKNVIKDIDNELEPLNMRIKRFEKLESDYKQTLLEEDKKKMEYNLSMQQVKRLKENIKHIFKGSVEELQEKIDSYDNILILKATEITELEAKLEDINKKDTKIRRVLGEEKVNVGTLRQQMKDYEKKVQSRNEILNDALRAWNLETVESDISNIELKALTKRLEEKLKETEHKVESNRVKREQDEQNVQRELDHIRSTHSKIESERDLKQNELIEVQRDNSSIKAEIKQIGFASNKLDSIDSKLQEAKNKMTKLSEELDVDAVKEEIQDLIKQRDDTETRLNNIDSQITALHKQSSLQNEYEFNKSTLLEKETEAKKIEERQKANLQQLLDIKDFPRRKLWPDIEDVQKDLLKELRTIDQEIQIKECDVSTIETTMEFNQKELLRKKKELALDKEKVGAICNYKEFTEALLLQQTKVKDLQHKRGLYTHQRDAYKEYMKQLKQSNPCCPLCHRNFEERNAVEKLLTEMEDEIKNHPNRLKECETELKVQQDKYDKMLQLTPVVEKIIQVEEEELEKLSISIEKAEKQLTQTHINVKELQSKKVNPEEKVAKIKELMDDIITWDRYIDEMSKVSSTIEDIKYRLNAAGVKSECTLEEAQAEREKKKIALKTVRDNIENLQLKLNKHNEALHAARASHNALHEEQLKIQSSLQKLKQLKDQQETLFSREISLRDSITKLEEKLTDVATQLNSKKYVLETKKKENKQKCENDRTSLNERSRQLTDLHKVQSEIEHFISRRIFEALTHSESKIQEYEKIIKECQSEKVATDKAITNLRDDVTHQEVRKRELSDNLQLRTIEETTEMLRQEYSACKEKRNAINIDEIQADKTVLKEKEGSLLRQKNMAIGNQEEVERVITDFTKELQKEVYRNARRNLKKKTIEVTVQEQTILDLKTSSKILDSAMLHYHEQRMALINKIMKQLWKHIYTGSDTTSIEIRTEPTEGVGTARRTYNYKLIQTKHGREMDMRGRCSAGQRVLASIIIRLALAETFCKECGILALDEPTTNLDEDNANSLAAALATVVKFRSQYQKNFQLIVISHDEKFLFKLADLNNKNGFYELYRKPDGLTAIRYCQVEGHHVDDLNIVKEEISSDEEFDAPSTTSHGKKQGADVTSVTSTSGTDTSSNRKRISWDKDSDDQEESRPQKKRYVFKH